MKVAVLQMEAEAWEHRNDIERERRHSTQKGQ